MTLISSTVRSIVTAALAFGGAACVVGCNGNAPDKTAQTGFRSDVTDIRPVEPASYQPPLYDTSAVIPVAPQPVTTEQQTTTITSAPVTTIMSTTTSGSTSGGAGTVHVVRHGETLFSIAKNAYGTGKAWKKITGANPGVTAAKLRVGQKLVLP